MFKAAIFHKHFFPPESQADLSDMEAYQYSPEAAPLPEITKDDILNVLDKRQPFSALDIDGISNAFLKALGDPFAEAIASLTQAC